MHKPVCILLRGAGVCGQGENLCAHHIRLAVVPVAVAHRRTVCGSRANDAAGPAVMQMDVLLFKPAADMFRLCGKEREFLQRQAGLYAR